MDDGTRTPEAQNDVEVLLWAFRVAEQRTGLKRDTVTMREKVLRALGAAVAPRSVLEVGTDELDAWLDSCRLERRSRDTYRSSLARFYAWAVTEGLVVENPAADLPRDGVEPEPTSDVEQHRPPRRGSSRARKGVRRDLWDRSTYDLLWVYTKERRARGEIGVSSTYQLRSRLYSLVDMVPADPARITRRHVERWLERPHLSVSYRRGMLGAARGFFRWLLLENVIAKDPTIGIARLREPRRLPRGMSAMDVARILAATDDPRTRLAVLLMVQEGLRRAEVTGLQWADIDFAERTLFVTGKGGHQRVLPISDETRAALGDYLAERGTIGGPLLVSRNNAAKGLSPGWVSGVVGRTMRDAGVKLTAGDGRSPHALRHTAAIDMLRAGAHLRDVQTALGHASITTTQRYIPFVVNDLRSAMGGRKYRGAHLQPVDMPTVDTAVER